MFGTLLVHLLCNAVVCVLPEYTIVYEHDRVDKIRVDSIHGSMCTCMWDQGSEIDLLVHAKSRQNCACYIAAMFDDRTLAQDYGWNAEHLK